MNIYDESIRRTIAKLNQELFIGRGSHSRELYFIKLLDCLATHFHIIGASNFGKSFYLIHLLRTFIELGIPASFIDPHGESVRAYLKFLASNPRLAGKGRILHLAPGGPGASVGLNPFNCGLTDPGEIASLLLEALIQRVFGRDSLNETPQLERVYRANFHVFAVNRLDLTQASQFLLTENRAFRESLLANVADEQVNLSWREIERLPVAEKRQVLASAWNRLQRLLAFPVIRDFFAAKSGTVNFAAVFKNQQILAVDLSYLPSLESQALIGTVLMNAFYNAAKHRPHSKRSVHFMAIDEFPQFLSTDIARSLDELRKFGIRMILAHQRFAQLSDDLRSAVITNAKIRTVFGGLGYDDAKALAHEIFPGEVRGDRVKHISYRTGFRPMLTKIMLEHESETEGNGDTDGEGWTDITITNTGESNAVTDADGTAVNTITTTHSYGSSAGPSGNHSRSRSDARTRGVTEAYLTEFQEFIEEAGRQFWSCDEQWEMLIARIMNLDRREVLVKAFSNPVLDICSPDVEIKPTFPRRKTARLRRLERQRRASLEESNPGSIKGEILPPKKDDDLPEDFHE